MHFLLFNVQFDVKNRYVRICRFFIIGFSIQDLVSIYNLSYENSLKVSFNQYC